MLCFGNSGKNNNNNNNNNSNPYKKLHHWDKCGDNVRAMRLEQADIDKRNAENNQRKV